MTQERFAEALDISVESVRQYESDKIMPSDDVVTRMVEVSGQPVGYVQPRKPRSTYSNSRPCAYVPGMKVV